jgi:hypothetical protein
MTCFFETAFINKLSHPGLFEITNAYVVDEGRKGSLFVRFKSHRNQLIHGFGGYLEIAIQQLMTSFIGERSADFDFWADNMTVTDGGDAYRVEVNFSLIPLPHRNNTESKNKCSCCGSTL